MESDRKPWTATGPDWTVSWSPEPPFLTGPEEKLADINAIIAKQAAMFNDHFMVAPFTFEPAKLSQSNVAQVAVETMARLSGEEIALDGDVSTFTPQVDGPLAHWTVY